MVQDLCHIIELSSLICLFPLPKTGHYLASAMLTMPWSRPRSVTPSKHRRPPLTTPRASKQLCLRLLRCVARPLPHLCTLLLNHNIHPFFGGIVISSNNQCPERSHRRSAERFAVRRPTKRTLTYVRTNMSCCRYSSCKPDKHWILQNDYRKLHVHLSCGSTLFQTLKTSSRLAGFLYSGGSPAVSA